jgi:alanine dehydrogenase
MAAARNFLGMGASVYILDKNISKLRELDHYFQGRVVTMVSHSFNVEKVCRFADVLVGAVLVPGARTPIVVKRDTLKIMRPRSVVIDLSIDQGGCIETSRPTTHSNATFIDEDLIHYCIPNMTGVLGRTATHALGNASWPFVKMIAEIGIEKALESSTTLKRGVYTHQGEITHLHLQDSLEGRR